MVLANPPLTRRVKTNGATSETNTLILKSDSKMLVTPQRRAFEYPLCGHVVLTHRVEGGSPNTVLKNKRSN
jgi:hypothetical protein